MPFLSEPQGRFLVGATTFLTRVKSPRSIGSIVLQDTRQPALFLRDVVFTAYYPVDNSIFGTASKGLDWVIRPLRESFRGFTKFSGLPRWVIWPVVYFFGAFIQIPVYPNAPLARPRPDLYTEGDKKQWPLVIFSHGLGGSRTAYSQLCSRLAASGKVVLAMEHRDGTGCACMRTADSTHQPKSILYYRNEDIIDGNDSGTAAPFPLRTDQLEFRREEVHTAYQAFSRFIYDRSSSDLESIDNKRTDYQSWWQVDSATGKGPICLDANVVLAGHSFGGCTVLSLISSNPPPGHSHIPVSHALLLDPWLEPLPLPGPIPLSRTLPSGVDDNEVRGSRTVPRMLVINSERFTLWKDHYNRLKDVVKAWEPKERRLLTLVGSTHEAFSDYPSLPLVRRAKAKTLMNAIGDLSLSFLDDNLDKTLESIPTTEMDIQVIGKGKDGRLRRKLVGNVGDVVAQ